MHTKKIKWLIYTVLVGLIPIFSRAIIWIVSKPGTLDFLACSDFIVFGLVLHISNINEVEHLDSVEREWKTIQNGLSIIFMIFYSILFSMSLLGDKIVDIKSLTICSVVLSVVSFFVSYAIYYHLSNFYSNQGNSP